MSNQSLSWGKPRHDWPKFMDLQELMESVPFCGEEQAKEILTELGQRRQGRVTVPSIRLIMKLDGDLYWAESWVKIRGDIGRPGKSYTVPMIIKILVRQLVRIFRLQFHLKRL